MRSLGRETDGSTMTQSTERDTAAEDPEDGSPRLAPLSLGFEFAAAIMGGCFAGFWVDRHFETRPWGTIGGATIGFVGGFYNFLRASIKAFHAAEGGGEALTNNTVQEIEQNLRDQR
jgi:F0F1-type ATP synthase assembly protein I